MKNTFLFLVLFLQSLFLYAQNDLCANAITLTPSTTCSSISGSFNGALLDGNASACAPNASQDVWYKFTATDPTMYVEVSNSVNIGLDVAMEIYSGGCSGTLVTCQNVATANMGYETYFSNTFVVGQTYYIRILNASSMLSTQAFAICVRKFPTPANDLCANAATLTPGTACNNVSGSFSGSFFDGNPSACAPNASQDVWYKFTATDPTMYVEVSNSVNIGLDVAMEIYSGGCSGTLVTCQNVATANMGYETYFSNTFVVGQTYYIRILNASSALSTQAFAICVRKFPTPANDLCANAATLTPGTACNSVSGSFSGSFFDGNPSACAPNASQDVWYKFTATDPTMYVEVSNSVNIGLDVAMEIYSGGCSGTLVTCQNVATANMGYETYFSNTFVVGQTYYIRILNASSALSTQAFAICVRKFPTPANDLCANAATLTPGTACNSVSGSFSGSFFDGNPSACAPNASQDVWYKFTATDPTMYVEVSNSVNIGLDVAMEIYSEGCSGTLVTCQNVATANMGYETYFSNTFVVGQTYYIRILNASSALSTQAFAICVRKFPTPENDLCANATTLTHSSPCTFISGTFSGASISSAAPACAPNASQDVWYKFVAQNQNLTISVNNSINIGLDVALEVYSVGCSGNLVVCRNNGGSTSGGESYSAADFQIGTTYFVRVVNASSNLSNQSFDICIAGASLGIDSETVQTLRVAPNPVKEVLRISGLEPQTAYSYEIFNAQGQNVLKGELSGDSISTQSLNRGIYVLRLNGEKGELVVRFSRE